MKRISVLIVAVFTSFTIYSQYNSAVGLGAGKRGAFINYKYFLEPERFMEFIGQAELFSQNVQGGSLIGIYGWHKEIHSSILQTTRLSWFYGVGIHAGYYNKWYLVDGQNIVAGPDVIIGSEYKFHSTIPFSVGAYGRLYYHAVHTIGGEHRRSDDWLDFGVFLRYIISD